MSNILLTPESIPILAKLLLVIIFVCYVLFYKPKKTEIKWFIGYLIGYATLDFFAFTVTAIDADWIALSYPLQHLGTILLSFCYVQFAYRLKERYFPKEEFTVLIITGLLAVIGSIFLIVLMITRGGGDYSIAQILLPYPILLIIWSAIIFYRKHRIVHSKKTNTSNYKGYLAFLLLTLVAIVQSFFPALNALEIVDREVFALVFFSAQLIIFILLTTAFFRFVADHSSLLIKMVGISLVLFLSIIGIQGYLIVPAELRLSPDLNRPLVHDTVLPYAILLLISSISVLITFPFFYSKSVLNPLRALLKGVEEVNRGNLSHRIEEQGQDELGTMSTHFNAMTSNLQRANEELKQYTEGLEQKVNERTYELQTANELLLRQTEELEQIQEFRSRLFQDISHELRTPITLISGPLKQLLYNSDLTKKEQKQLHVSLRNSDRLQQLVEQIIELNRLESNQMTFHSSVIDLRGKLHVLVQSYESLIKSKGLNLSVELPEEPIAAQLDEDKFEKIITNLISNAIKFTPSGESISVFLKQKKNTALIEISDTGSGISKDHLPHIFERFQTSAHSDVEYREGLGVGLAITKEYVELHSGSIEVESKPGEGSKFKVIFPVLNDDTIKAYNQIPVSTNEREQEIPKEPSLHTKETKHILLVEDNQDMAEYVESILEAHGYKTSYAEHGKAGLSFLEDNTPDLIISDIMMPEMDGMEFLKQLRSKSAFENTPTIFLSARSDIEGKLESFRLGINDYLVKPFNPDELIARIQNLLTFQKNRKELALELSEEHLEPVKEQFIKKLTELVEQRISNSSFNLEELAGEMAMSRSTLYREVKRATGFSAGAFVKEIRLQKARQALEHKSVRSMSELSSGIGFSTVSYFTKQFFSRFGKKPQEYLN